MTAGKNAHLKKQRGTVVTMRDPYRMELELLEREEN